MGDGGQKSCVIGVKIFIFNQQINSLPPGNSSVDQWGGGGGGGGGEEDGRTGGLDLPGKSQVIWVSIGNKQLDPPTVGLDLPGKSQVIWVSIGNKQLDPPPWKKFDPLQNLKK